jgi:hypothetical protein
MTMKVVESVEVLQNVALQDRSPVVRVYAVRALSAIDPRSSSETFRTVWDQATDTDLRTAAFEGMLQTPDSPAWVEAGLQDKDPRIRYLSFRAWQSRLPPVRLGTRPLRNSGEVLRLEAFLKDPLRGIREGARLTLEKAGYRIVETGSVYAIAGEQ